MGLVDSVGDGNIWRGTWCPSPFRAEEYVELAYRNKLIEQGKISYIGGKPELIPSVSLMDVDMADADPPDQRQTRA